jgi:hypothetical protein
VQADASLQIHLMKRYNEPPVPRVELPEEVEEDDDRRSKILLEEVLGIRAGIRRRLEENASAKSGTIS